MPSNEQAKVKAPRRAPMGPGGQQMTEKPKNFKKTWGKLLGYIKEYLPVIVIALVLAIAGTVFNIIGPRKLSEMTTAISEVFITGSVDMDTVTSIGLLLVLLFGVAALFDYIQGFIMATVTQRVSNKMRGQISTKINRLPLKYFDSTNFGDIMSRVTNDVDTIGQTLSQSISSLITATVMFVGVLIMMFITDWIMALTAIGSSLIGFVFMAVVMGKSQKHFTAVQSELGKLNGHIEETYAGQNVVKSYNGEKQSKDKFNEVNTALKQSAKKSQFLSGLMMPMMSFIGNFGFVAVCVVGAVLLKDGKIAVGVIVEFMLYIRLFMQPLSQFAQGAQSLQSTAAAGERVFGFLEEKELSDESNKTQSLDAIKGDVKFENVRFGYNEDKIIINDFSANIKAGQKIAIVGPTGAGKTTLVNLLMRFYELNSGEIYIDGVPTSSLTRENVHKLFCMVLQDTWLFEGTIRDNIIYNKKQTTNEELKAACKAVGVHHFIRTLPNGYDTVLSDNANLSSGQKQLMTIARAMIENAPMLILDEATSSVDTRTEVLIQKAMDKLMQNRTSFVIAHRLSTIKNADMILVMKDGDIVEQGNHNDLMKQDGFYANLYNSQFA